MLNPAKLIIDICGGVARTAELSGRNRSNVYRWTKPEDSGGTGGEVPRAAKNALLVAADEIGIDLKPEHFVARK